jgi:hypothetical protein
MKGKLKIGILLNNYMIPAWEYQIIRSLVNSDFSEIDLVIFDKHESTSADRESLKTILVSLIEKADRKIFKGKHDYFLKKDGSDLLKGIPVIEFSSAKEETINAVLRLNPDIVLAFGFHKIIKDLINVPKYGVWINSVGDSQNLDDADPGFWEVIRNHPVTNSTIGIVKDESLKLETIFSSFESTSLFSVNANRNNVYWRSALFIPRLLSGLYKYGDDYLPRLKNRFKEINLKAPSPAVTKQNPLIYFVKVAKSVQKKLFYQDDFNWKILFDIKSGFSTDFNNFKILPSPPEVFWADPFVVAEKDNYYVFVEEYIYKAKKAHISVLKLDKKGSLLNSEIIIDKPYHLSYPFIFQIDGTYYMIPETCKNRTIELYKCLEFPYKWEFDRNLMENLSAVDTTLFFYNDKWWLFTSIDQTENISGCSTELFLFSSDNIFSGDWKGHPDNPIVSDIRMARQAGKLFIHEGKIYRPSQDCSVRYGRGFNLSEITKLTDTEYSERVLSKIEPSWDKKLKGTHTFNFDKDFTIIDVYSFRKRLSVS